jgi:CRP-like cAMP-binding protein
VRHAASSPNRLLASLAEADLALLRPHLKPRELKQEAILIRAGQPVEEVYFPHSGIISLVVELPEGLAIEVAMIGRDSIHGATAAMDGQVSLNTAIVQLGGTCEILEVSHFRKVAEQSLPLRTVLLRHEQVLLAQAQNRRPVTRLIMSKPGCPVGCCGRVTCPAAIGWNSPRSFSPRCSARGGAAFHRSRARSRKPASSTMPEGTSISSMWRVYEKRPAIATER